MKVKAEESQVCCCVDVGAVIDGSEVTTAFDDQYADKQGAEAMLGRITMLARKAENGEPAVINHEITENEGGVNLKASVTFECQAENMIFQMSLSH